MEFRFWPFQGSSPLPFPSVSLTLKLGPGTSLVGPVVENPPPVRGDVGSVPGQGTKISQAALQLENLYTAAKTQHSQNK